MTAYALDIIQRKCQQIATVLVRNITFILLKKTVMESSSNDAASLLENIYSCTMLTLTSTFSVVQQREQHQHSRPHFVWELHQPLRHGPLQPGRLGKPLRTGRATEHGVLPAHQPHLETRPLPEPAEPRSPEGHMTA